MQKGIVLSVLIGIFLILSVGLVSSVHTECHDGEDNNENGLIDALVDFESENGETFIVGEGFGLSDTNKNSKPVCRFTMSKHSSIRTCSDRAMLLSFNAPWDNDDFRNIQTCIPEVPIEELDPTVLKICELAGYRDVSKADSWVPQDRGRCNFDSPGDNIFIYWDEANNRFEDTRAKPKKTRRFIIDLVCINKLSACSNGLDDDGDGFADYEGTINYLKDDGCDNPNDNSEIPHDPGCDSPDDPTEDEEPEDCKKCRTYDPGIPYCSSDNRVVHDTSFDSSRCSSPICDKDIIIGRTIKNCGDKGLICVDGSCVLDDNLNWANLNQIAIGEGFDKTTADLGDTVLMIFKNQNLKKGVDVTYEVLEKFFLTYKGINTIEENNAIIGKVIEDGFAVGKVTITEKDFEIDFPKLKPAEKFIFRTNLQKDSNLLFITPKDNAAPTTKIDLPKLNSNFIIQGQSDSDSTPLINFNHISSDEDDDLKITWKYGGGKSSGELLDCLSINNCNTTHSYSSPGTKRITLQATEMGRPSKEALTAFDSTVIYVYKEGFNIFAIIDNPTYSNRFLKAGSHLISGESSFVAECFSSQNDCTDNSCYEVINTLGGNSLWCYRFVESDDEGFTFEWSFDGDIDSDHTDSTNFYKEFLKAGRHDIDLEVSYTLP